MHEYEMLQLATNMERNLNEIKRYVMVNGQQFDNCWEWNLIIAALRIAGDLTEKEESR